MTEPFFTAHRESDSLLVIETQGKMDATSMEVALDMLVAEMEGMHHANMILHTRDVAWPTLGAIAVELRHWVQLFAMVEKIDRIAVLSDQNWLKRVAEFESLLIPNLVIRAFAADEEAAARAWLEDATPA